MIRKNIIEEGNLQEQRLQFRGDEIEILSCLPFTRGLRSQSPPTERNVLQINETRLVHDAEGFQTSQLFIKITGNHSGSAH